MTRYLALFLLAACAAPPPEGRLLAPGQGTGQTDRGVDSQFGDPSAQLLIDSTHAYWTRDGVLNKLPLSGGTPEQTGDGSTEPFPAGRIALGERDVFFISGQRIVAAPKDGGAVRILAVDEEGPRAIAVDAESVYWTALRIDDSCQPSFDTFLNETGAVRAVAIAGSAVREVEPSRVGSGPSCNHWMFSAPFALAIAPEGPFWSTPNGLFGPGGRLLSSKLFLYRMAIAGGAVFWEEEGRIRRALASGGPAETMHIDLGDDLVPHQSVYDFAVDEKELFLVSQWTCFPGFDTEDNEQCHESPPYHGYVRRVSLSGDDPEVLAGDRQRPWAVAIDRGNVYWLNDIGEVRAISWRELE